MFAQDRATVYCRRASPGDCGTLGVSTLDHPGDASGGIFGGNALDMWMLGEETLTLGERDRMRFHRRDRSERCVRTSDEVVRNGNDDLVRNEQRAFEKQIIRAMHAPGETVLNGR